MSSVMVLAIAAFCLSICVNYDCYTIKAHNLRKILVHVHRVSDQNPTNLNTVAMYEIQLRDMSLHHCR